MNSAEFIGKIVKVKIDRPLGSKHPKWGFIYTLNYGFIPETLSGDGEELDAYILGVFEPIKTFEGKCIAVIKRKSEDDDKLIIAPKEKMYTDEQIGVLVEFQERWFDYIILR